MTLRRAFLWVGFLAEFGWLWNQMPSALWRPLITIPLAVLAALWLRAETRGPSLDR